jgi:hypothetical protein
MNSDNHLARAGSTALTPVSPEEASLLWAPAERKVRQPAQLHGITDLAQMGFSRISDRPQVVTGEESEWLIFPADRDPLYQQRKLAAKPAVSARVTELLSAGIHFDALAIAHEVPVGSYARVRTTDDLQKLIAPPTPRSLKILATITGCLLDGIGCVLNFILNRKIFILDPFGILPPTSDPMLFGAVVATPPARVGNAALYFLIARWDY